MLRRDISIKLYDVSVCNDFVDVLSAIRLGRAHGRGGNAWHDRVIMARMGLLEYVNLANGTASV